MVPLPILIEEGKLIEGAPNPPQKKNARGHASSLCWKQRAKLKKDIAGQLRLQENLLTRYVFWPPSEPQLIMTPGQMFTETKAWT